MKLPPIRWLAHVNGNKVEDPPNTETMRCIEMEIQAATKEEACQAAHDKGVKLGYKVWFVRATPLPKSGEDDTTRPVINAVALPALPAPEPKEDKSIDSLMKDYSVFYSPIRKPVYGKEISCDSSP